ncbi:hypothetical protein M2282_002165 [Variovorax boronicumulans]|nr:hypothetical protein [Variovorax boronicumulans]
MTAPELGSCPLSRLRERVRVRAAGLSTDPRFPLPNALTPALSPRGEGARL